MRASVTFVLCFLASTWAYQILTPNAQVGWTSQGTQTVTWTMVDTDPATFNMTLVNDNGGFAPQVLLTLVDGSADSVTVTPPSGGFPTGSAFRVNFLSVSLTNEGILAQSNQFNITSGTSTSGASGVTGATSGALASQTGTSGSFGTSGLSGSSASGITGSSGSSASTPTSSSGATSSYPVQMGFLAAFSFLGFALA